MKKITLHTDGACKRNPGPGGIGVILKFTDANGKPHRQEMSQGYRVTTNNRMEIRAVIAGLEALNQSCEVTLFSDSQYVVNAINKWLADWEKNGWRSADNKAIRNSDLWQQVSKLRQTHSIIAEWIKGHADSPDNIRCDELANEATLRDDLITDEGYPNIQGNSSSSTPNRLE